MVSLREVEAQRESMLDLSHDDDISDQDVEDAVLQNLPYGQLLWSLVPALITLVWTVSYKPQHERSFLVSDTSIMRPHKDDTVHAAIPVIVYPILMLCIYFCEHLFHRQELQSKPRSTWAAALFSFGCLVTFIWVFVFYGFPNMIVGRHRPDFLARCQPKPGLNSNTYYTTEVCTNPDKTEVLRGMASFPSGHSSFSSGFATYASLYFFWCFFVRHPSFRRKLVQRSTYRIIKRELYTVLLMIPMTAPMIFALYVAGSRVVDNRHHPSDVVGGLLAGIIGGLAGFAPTLAYYKASLTNAAGITA